MNLTQLRLFRDIAREMSFAKAAELNHISQPAVSMQIRKLEDSLGKQLLARTPHNVQLTPAGRLILNDVKDILALSEGLREKLNEDEAAIEGDIRIAAIYSIGMYEIGATLAAFMKAFPAVHIQLEYRQSNEIYNLLLKEKIDLGLVAYPEKRTRIESLPYGFDELVVITAANHPLAERKSIPIDRLAEQDFVAFDEGIPTREATDKLFKAHGVQVAIRMTNDNIFTLKKAVEAGVGISIVPSSAVEEEIHQGTLKRLKISKIDTRRELAMIKLRRKQSNRPLEKFIQTMLAKGQQS